MFLPTVAVIAFGLTVAHAEVGTRVVTHRHESPVLRARLLDRLSSGALMMLDREGDLVQWPVAPAGLRRDGTIKPKAREPTLDAGLDARVGWNIRLGDDPSPLPVGFRAQAEPHIARSPINPDVLAVTFQEGRQIDGGAVNCGYSISTNGGLTWSRALIPGVTPSSGGPYYRATDPVAGVGTNGFIYLNTLALVNSSQTIGALLVSRSTNGGTSFDAPIESFRSSNTDNFPDKNWMAINTFPGTSSAGRIVQTFTWFTFSAGTSPIALIRSDDGGLTWSSMMLLTPASSGCQGSQPVFLPNGQLAVAYWRGDLGRMELVISTNGGVNFNAPRTIAALTPYDAPGVRDGVTLPAAATDRTNGHLYVTYQATVSGAPRILFTKSTNGGTNWSAPVVISDNPVNAPVFNPALAVSPDGKVVTVTFYDGRVLPGQTNLYDVYLAQSFDGGTNWQPNLRLTTASTDVRLAPLTSRGYMIGDYMGIAETTNPDVPAVPVWIDTRTGNPDPFIGRVGIATNLNFRSWRAGRFSFAQIGDASVGGIGADPEHDLQPNLLEYALGLDPWAADQFKWPVQITGAGPGASLTSSYLRLRHATDLNCAWQSSSNLTSWQTAAGVGETSAASTNSQFNSVSVNFGPPAGSRFYRLGVVLSN